MTLNLKTLLMATTSDVKMGPDQGGALVVATYPGDKTRKRGLYNYGKNGDKIKTAAYAGCYTEQLSGSITVPMPDGTSYTVPD